MKSQKGITRIQFLIVVFVLLILAGISLYIATDGKIFKPKTNKSNQNNENLIQNNEQEEEIETPERIEDADISELSIGDYISNYPVKYNNVNSNAISRTGWRIAGIEQNGENSYVKLIAEGAPLVYSFSGKYDSNEVYLKMKNEFLTADYTKKGVVGNLVNAFSNNYTETVGLMTKKDVDNIYKAVTGKNETVKYTSTMNGSDGTEVSGMDLLDIGTSYYIIDESKPNRCCFFGGDRLYDPVVAFNSYMNVTWNNYTVRPVVTLKSDVKFREAEKKLKNSTTWELYF